MLLSWARSQTSSLWKRGEEFLYGRNRTAGGGSRKQKKSLTAEKGWQPKGPKSCSQQWRKEHHRHPGVRAAVCVATALGIKEFLFTLCFSLFSCYTPSARLCILIEILCSLSRPVNPLQEHWTHTWDLLKALKVLFCFVFFFPSVTLLPELKKGNHWSIPENKSGKNRNCRQMQPAQYLFQFLSK